VEDAAETAEEAAAEIATETLRGLLRRRTRYAVVVYVKVWCPARDSIRMGKSSVHGSP
jgi:hypothetical protein